MDEQLVMFKTDTHFYMTSYMVYLLATRTTNYLELYKKGSMHGANAWPYVVYPQLVKKKIPIQRVEYRVVNDSYSS